jgi:hypothetical protein
MPFFALFLIVLVSAPCLGLAPNESPDQVWEVGERRWTFEEEQRFEKWIEETITEDFFIRYRIPTDCADATYAIRWIYARINHLPAAATTTEGRFVGHWSTNWKHLPTHPEWDRDERFRTALFYLFPRTWTGTLPLDTYPIRISPESARPGTLFLVTESHTGIIGRVSLDGSHAHPVQTWESALPVKVQKLNLRYFFSTKPVSKDRSGLVRFRWPVSENGEWAYLPVHQHPFYSEEQYSSRFYNGKVDFVEAVAKRIDPTEYNPSEKMARVIKTTTRLLKERVSLVQEGYQECRREGCPEGSELWEIHSTPGRDGMITSLMNHLSEIIESNRLDRTRAKEMMEAIPIAISQNRSVTLHHVYQNHLWLSFDPEGSIEARWGLKKCEMIHAQTRTARDSISFIERTYRNRDPKYASFSIRWQQEFLRRLGEEWRRSECTEAALRPDEKVRPAPVPWVAGRPGRGSKRCEAIRAETRSAHDSIAFIEKTYRKKDPAYADFSLRWQQELLRRLGEEWSMSACAEPAPAPEKIARVSPPPDAPTQPPQEPNRTEAIRAEPAPAPERITRVSPPPERPPSPGRDLKRCEAILAETRSAHDSIAFIEKTYRKKDPAYADFSIRWQQELLWRLGQDWTRLGCGDSSR